MGLMCGKFMKIIHQHGGFLFLALYMETVPLKALCLP